MHNVDGHSHSEVVRQAVGIYTTAVASPHLMAALVLFLNSSLQNGRGTHPQLLNQQQKRQHQP